MRNATIILAAVGVAACGGRANWQPVSLTGPAPSPVAATTECVRNQLQDRGYEVSMGASANDITGVRRNELRWYQRAVGLRGSVDQINASIRQGQLRVTAISSDVNQDAGAGELASEAAQEDARQLLAECGR